MSKDDKKLLELARKRFKQSENMESETRIDALDDVRFVRLGEQWPESVRRARETPGQERPMLTINRIYQFRNQIVNEIRQNEPQIKIRPSDSESDDEVAEVYDGLIKHIQECTDAEIAYDTAAEWQVDTGLGYFYITTDYCDPASFDQDIKIKPIVDRFTVYADPTHIEPDGSDMDWCFVAENIPREEFEASYQGVTDDWGERGVGDMEGWFDHEFVRIANYYYIEKTEKELCLLADGSSVYKDELPKGAVVVKKRKSEVKVCKWAKLAGDKVLEETTLHTSFVPIIPVYGAVIWVEGKKHTHGLTRFSKDPARQYNYYQSANTELLALAPKSPYIAATGQIDNNRMQWGTANIINYPVLEYDPIDVNGNVLPPPRREPPPGTNPGFESAMNRSEMDIKAVMGMFDSTMGANESQQSGRALQTQDNRASIGNFHFNDNLKRSIKHAGRIIVEMIPKIYDTPRALSILGLDGTPQSVQVDPHAPQAVTESEDETGAVTKIFNLSAGKYSVVVDTGPTYQTRRQEAVNSQLEMCRSNPQLMQIAGDLIVKNMDWLGAEDIADRLKLMLPPQVLADIKQKESGQQANDPAIEQQMNKMADMVQHLSQELQAAKSGQQEALEKLEIERYRAQTERAKVDAEIGFKDAELVHEGIKLTHDMAMADLQHTLATQQVLAESQEDEGQENETPANAQNADAGASTPPAQPAPTAEQPAANSSGDVQ